jgi:hypothetical protein
VTVVPATSTPVPGGPVLPPPAGGAPETVLDTNLLFVIAVGLATGVLAIRYFTSALAADQGPPPAPAGAPSSGNGPFGPGSWPVVMRPAARSDDDRKRRAGRPRPGRD